MENFPSFNGNSTDLSEKSFAQKYMEALHQKYPQLEIDLVDDRTINVKHGSLDVNVFLGNAYREYQSSPKSIQEIFDRYILSLKEVLYPDDEINIANIVPIIKSVDSFEKVVAVDKSGTIMPIEDVTEKYNDQLIIVYAIDSENSIKYLQKNDLKKISVNMDELKNIAIKNLANTLTNIEWRGGNGVYMIIAGGNYEASLILMPEIINKNNFDVAGDLVIAVPNRDMLLITGSEDAIGLDKIKTIASKTFATGNYNISPYLYKWNGNIFVKFD